MPPPTPPAANVCIPAVKARLVMADLLRLPVVLDQNRELRKANVARRNENGHLREALTAKDTVIAATDRRVAVAQVLGRDAENRATAWKGKARKRSWTNVALSALLVLVTVVAVR